MRRAVTTSLFLVLVLAACRSTEPVEVTAGEGGELSSETTTESPPTTIATTTSIAAARGPSDYLLTPNDLPGWKHVRPMSFDAEPTYETVGCESMATVFSAHAEPGTRVRASTDGVALRHTVVEMSDAPSAEAVLDAAEVVWEECNPLTIDTGDQWWVEPIEVPHVEGWRSAGLALGMANDLIWTILWFQQDTTIVFVDLDAAHPWRVLEPVHVAAAGRLTGDTAPVPTTQPPAPTTSTPRTIPVPPSSTPPVATDWREHPAAVFVPDPSLFGSGYELDRVVVDERAPSDPDDVMDGCPVAPPPTMDGLSVDYGHESDTAEIEILIGLDDAVWAQDTVDAFRALATCEPATLGVDELSVIEPVSGADDAVVLEVSSAFGPETVRALVLMARYGDMIVGVFVGVESGSPVAVPPVDELTGWADSIAAAS